LQGRKSLTCSCGLFEKASVVKISANIVNKLEEWLLAPPVYSLRRTDAYNELPFAEPSRAEHTRDGYTVLIFEID
jgi:hypothetical protein